MPAIPAREDAEMAASEGTGKLALHDSAIPFIPGLFGILVSFSITAYKNRKSISIPGNSITGFLMLFFCNVR